MKSTPNDDEMLTCLEVCSWLNITRGRLSELRAEGKFPAPTLVINRNPRWARSIIAAWIEGVEPAEAGSTEAASLGCFDEPYPGQEDVAAMLSITVRRLHARMTLGKAPKPHAIVGGLPRWRRGDVIEWIDAVIAGEEDRPRPPTNLMVGQGACNPEDRRNAADPEQLETLLTSRDVATWLRISSRFLNALQSSGKIPPPYMWIGDSPRWRLSDLDDWFYYSAAYPWAHRNW